MPSKVASSSSTGKLPRTGTETKSLIKSENEKLQPSKTVLFGEGKTIEFEEDDYEERIPVTRSITSPNYSNISPNSLGEKKKLKAKMDEKYKYRPKKDNPSIKTLIEEQQKRYVFEAWERKRLEEEAEAEEHERIEREKQEKRDEQQRKEREEQEKKDREAWKAANPGLPLSKDSNVSQKPISVQVAKSLPKKSTEVEASMVTRDIIAGKTKSARYTARGRESTDDLGEDLRENYNLEDSTRPIPKAIITAVNTRGSMDSILELPDEEEDLDDPRDDEVSIIGPSSIDQSEGETMPMGKQPTIKKVSIGEIKEREDTMDVERAVSFGIEQRDTIGHRDSVDGIVESQDTIEIDTGNLKGALAADLRRMETEQFETDSDRAVSTTETDSSTRILDSVRGKGGFPAHLLARQGTRGFGVKVSNQASMKKVITERKQQMQQQMLSAGMQSAGGHALGATPEGTPSRATQVGGINQSLAQATQAQQTDMPMGRPKTLTVGLPSPRATQIGGVPNTDRATQIGGIPGMIPASPSGRATQIGGVPGMIPASPTGRATQIGGVPGMIPASPTGRATQIMGGIPSHRATQIGPGNMPHVPPPPRASLEMMPKEINILDLVPPDDPENKVAVEIASKVELPMPVPTQRERMVHVNLRKRFITALQSVYYPNQKRMDKTLRFLILLEELDKKEDLEVLRHIRNSACPTQPFDLFYDLFGDQEDTADLAREFTDWFMCSENIVKARKKRFLEDKRQETETKLKRMRILKQEYLHGHKKIPENSYLDDYKGGMKPVTETTVETTGKGVQRVKTRVKIDPNSKKKYPNQPDKWKPLLEPCPTIQKRESMSYDEYIAREESIRQKFEDDYLEKNRLHEKLMKQIKFQENTEREAKQKRKDEKQSRMRGKRQSVLGGRADHAQELAQALETKQMKAVVGNANFNLVKSEMIGRRNDRRAQKSAAIQEERLIQEEKRKSVSVQRSMSVEGVVSRKSGGYTGSANISVAKNSKGRDSKSSGADSCPGGKSKSPLTGPFPSPFAGEVGMRKTAIAGKRASTADPGKKNVGIVRYNTEDMLDKRIKKMLPLCTGTANGMLKSPTLSKSNTAGGLVSIDFSQYSQARRVSDQERATNVLPKSTTVHSPMARGSIATRRGSIAMARGSIHNDFEGYEEKVDMQTYVKNLNRLGINVDELVEDDSTNLDMKKKLETGETEKRKEEARKKAIVESEKQLQDRMIRVLPCGTQVGHYNYPEELIPSPTGLSPIHRFSFQEVVQASALKGGILRKPAGNTINATGFGATSTTSGGIPLNSTKPKDRLGLKDRDTTRHPFAPKRPETREERLHRLNADVGFNVWSDMDDLRTKMPPALGKVLNGDGTHLTASMRTSMGATDDRSSSQARPGSQVGKFRPDSQSSQARPGSQVGKLRPQSSQGVGDGSGLHVSGKSDANGVKLVSDACGIGGVKQNLVDMSNENRDSLDRNDVVRTSDSGTLVKRKLDHRGTASVIISNCDEDANFYDMKLEDGTNFNPQFSFAFDDDGRDEEKFEIDRLVSDCEVETADRGVEIPRQKKTFRKVNQKRLEKTLDYTDLRSAVAHSGLNKTKNSRAAETKFQTRASRISSVTSAEHCASRISSEHFTRTNDVEADGGTTVGRIANRAKLQGRNVMTGVKNTRLQIGAQSKQEMSETQKAKGAFRLKAFDKNSERNSFVNDRKSVMSGDDRKTVKISEDSLKISRRGSRESRQGSNGFFDSKRGSDIVGSDMMDNIYRKSRKTRITQEEIKRRGYATFVDLQKAFFGIESFDLVEGKSMAMGGMIGGSTGGMEDNIKSMGDNKTMVKPQTDGTDSRDSVDSHVTHSTLTTFRTPIGTQKANLGIASGWGASNKPGIRFDTGVNSIPASFARRVEQIDTTMGGMMDSRIKPLDNSPIVRSESLQQLNERGGSPESLAKTENLKKNISEVRLFRPGTAPQAVFDHYLNQNFVQENQYLAQLDKSRYPRSFQVIRDITKLQEKRIQLSKGKIG